MEMVSDELLDWRPGAMWEGGIKWLTKKLEARNVRVRPRHESEGVVSKGAGPQQACNELLIKVKDAGIQEGAAAQALSSDWDVSQDPACALHQQGTV